MERRDTADPSRDVGRYRHVEDVPPYTTWSKRENGVVVNVLVSDTGPRSDDDYWAHAEVLKNGEYVPRSDEFIAAGDDRSRVIREATRWMRNNPNFRGDHGRYASEPADRGFNFGGEFW